MYIDPVIGMSESQTPTEGDITTSALELDFESLNLDSEDDHPRVPGHAREQAKEHERKVQEERAIIQTGDEDELERFRREWRAEVTTRRGVGEKVKVKVGDNQKPSPSMSTVDEQKSWRKETNDTKVARISKSPENRTHSVHLGQSTTKAELDNTRDRSKSPTDVKVKMPSGLPTTRSPEAGPSRPKTQLTAVQLYAQAVENEQAGQLNDALILYRRAFKIDGELHSTESHTLYMLTIRL